MKKIAIYLIPCFMISIFLFSALVPGEKVDTETYTITITTGNNAISVKEDLTIDGKSNQTFDTLTFWIMSGANNVNMLFNNNEAQSITHVGNEYTSDISNLDIKMNQSLAVTISYILEKDVEEFEKTILHNTTKILVKFNGNSIYAGENLKSGLSFTLQLYEPTEAPLAWYFVVILILLVILLVVSTAYAFKKQRTKTIDIGSESDELLSTKKTLLMSILKDIEKQYRAKQISDDTYHKLKDLFKQQAVDAMKKLEDIESKIE